MGICVSCRRRDLQAPDKRAGGAGGGRVPAKGAAAELLPRRVDPAMANSISNIKMTNPIKGIVSKRRKRYIKDGFNLDLAYITDRLIAMGFPAEKLEGVYRNHIDEVHRFLEQMHKDHYKIYNLCSERCYDSAKFHGRVARYAFEDHAPPNMELIQPFCEDVHTWLSADPRNVAAVHCKAGKGRTGTMVCCYLLYSKQKATADEALKFYGTKRTHDEKGVTIPSQRRYVEYYAALVRSGLQYTATKLHIRELVMSPPPSLNGGQCTLELTVSQATPPLKAPSAYHEVRKHDSCIRVVLEQCTPLHGDVRVDVYSKPKMMMRKEKLFHFWFNTFFVAQRVGAAPAHPPKDSMNLDTFKLTLNKWQLDDAHKDKLHKIYAADFKVEVILQRQPESSRFSACGRAPSPPSSSASDTTDPDPDSEHWDSGERPPAPAPAPASPARRHPDRAGYLRLDERDDGTGRGEHNADCMRLEPRGEQDAAGYMQLDSPPEMESRRGVFQPERQPDKIEYLLESPLCEFETSCRSKGVECVKICPHGCVYAVSDADRNARPDELCPHGYRIVTELAYSASDISRDRSDCTESFASEMADVSYAILSENSDVEMASCNNCIHMDFSQNSGHKKGKIPERADSAKSKSLHTSPIKTMENAGILTKDGYMLIDRTPRLQKDASSRSSEPIKKEISERCARLSDPTGRKCKHSGMVSKDGYMLVDATPRQPQMKDGRRTPNASGEVLGLPAVTNMRLNSESLEENYMEFTAADGYMKAVERDTKITNYADEYAFMCPDMSDEKSVLCHAQNCKIIAEMPDEGSSEACYSEAQCSSDSKPGKNKKHSFFKKDDYKNDKGKIPKVSSDHTISDESKKKYNFFQRRDEEGSKPKFAIGDVRASWKEFTGIFTDSKKKKDRDDS